MISGNGSHGVKGIGGYSHTIQFHFSCLYCLPIGDGACCGLIAQITTNGAWWNAGGPAVILIRGG
jgi:hypothetical protein